MLITAVSYGRMGALYPTAGSATHTSEKAKNPHLGFLAGLGHDFGLLAAALINTVWHFNRVARALLPHISLHRMGGH